MTMSAQLNKEGGIASPEDIDVKDPMPSVEIIAPGSALGADTSVVDQHSDLRVESAIAIRSCRPRQNEQINCA